MRDVFLGRPVNADDVRIYDHLKRLKQRNALICPISCTVFWEVMRQSDRATRLATADVIDIFSDGICTQPPDELVKRELSCFFTRLTLPNKEMIPLLHTVWTKVPFLWGDLMVSFKKMPQATESILQRAFDDELWQLSFRDLIERISGTEADREWAASQDLADQLTEGKFAHATECKNFDELLLTEFTGAIDGYLDQLGEVAVLISQLHGLRHTPSSSDLRTAAEMYARLLKAAIHHKRVSSELSSIFIPSALHAAVRHNQQRKFKANDMDDFRHAYSALPYFNAFATEKSLQHLICSKPLCLDQTYNCRVLSSRPEILEYLETL